MLESWVCRLSTCILRTVVADAAKKFITISFQSAQNIVGKLFGAFLALGFTLPK